MTKASQSEGDATLGVTRGPFLLLVFQLEKCLFFLCNYRVIYIMFDAEGFQTLP